MKGSLLAGIFAAFALAIVACSHGPQSAMLPGLSASEPAAIADASGAASKTGTANFTILVPAHPVTSQHPDVISPAAQGVSIVVTASGAKPKTVFFALTSKAAYCSGGTPSVPLRCAISLTVPAATDTFLVTIRAAANANGIPLAVARETAKVKPGGTTAVQLTTYGIVKFLQIALADAYPVVGKKASIPLYATAADAWGYTIVGGYTSPIALADGDASGNSTLSSTSAANSNQLAAIRLNYNGKTIARTTLTATIGTLSAAAVFAPGANGTIADPPVLHVAYGTTGTPVRLGGPGTVGPFSVQTHADVAGNQACARFASVQGSGREFLVTASGNLGTCWLAVRDKAGHNGSIPVLVSAFSFASAPPTGAPSASPSPTPSPTPQPTATPVPTPTPGVAPVMVNPNAITICPKTGTSACNQNSQVIAVRQTGTPGTFFETDTCNPAVAIVTSIDPVGPVVHYRVQAQSKTGTCVVTFTGIGGKKGLLSVQVQASGIIINAEPQRPHSLQKERSKR